MAGVPLLQINDRKIINWWNVTYVAIHTEKNKQYEAGTSTIWFNDSGDEELTRAKVDLTEEETKAFLLFVKDNGDRLNVRDSSPQAVESCDAGDRFADLAVDED